MVCARVSCSPDTGSRYERRGRPTIKTCTSRTGARSTLMGHRISGVTTVLRMPPTTDAMVAPEGFKVRSPANEAGFGIWQPSRLSRALDTKKPQGGALLFLL